MDIGVITCGCPCLVHEASLVTSLVGYDALIFLRFHRLSLRIVAGGMAMMLILCPVNYFGGGVFKREGVEGEIDR